MKKKKKACVYDRWLHALGGGEQVAFGIIGTLQKLGYRIEILTHRKVDKREIEKKMNTNLGDIRIRVVPYISDSEVEQYTPDYDLFVNVTFMSFVPSLANKSILYVHFPVKTETSVYEKAKRILIVPFLKSLFVYPEVFEGFKYDEYRNGRILKWLGKKSSIILSGINRPCTVNLHLYMEYLSFATVDQIKLLVNDIEVKWAGRQVDNRRNVVRYTLRATPDGQKKIKITILLPETEYNKKLALATLTVRNSRFFLYNLFKKIFPAWEIRLHGGPGATPVDNLRSYDLILANSAFTQKWIKKYWGLESRVLNPPVNCQEFRPAKNKKNIILNVGRFFVTGHSKKQLELVRGLKMLVDLDVEGWGLHFVGGVSEGEVHQKYLQRVKEEARGYPVFFHIDASFGELKKLYSMAKIYWHGTGLGENEKKHPIRFEHFGITTVEAMAAGAVPVVYNGGGQPEIVKRGKNGFLWDNLEELISNTEKLIKNQKFWKKLSRYALRDSQFYKKENFVKRFQEMCRQII